MQELTNSKVSVVVTTRNSSKTLEACLISIKNQTWKNLEVIVVDNQSTDSTVEIAKKFTRLVFDAGPERSAQRNYGVSKSSGDYVCIIDIDMELGINVIEESMKAFLDPNQNFRKQVGGVIIPEESFGIGFWAKVKALERSFYIGNDSIEAPRLFNRELYEVVGGYDPAMTGGEDWDLSSRIKERGLVSVRSNSMIRHNEGELTLRDLYKKKKIYGKAYKLYTSKRHNKKDLSNQGAFARVNLFLRHWKSIGKHPLLYPAIFAMKAVEFLGALAGDRLVQTGKKEEGKSSKDLYIVLNGVTTEISGGDEHAIRLHSYVKSIPSCDSQIIAPKALFDIIKSREEGSGTKINKRFSNTGLFLLFKYIYRTFVGVFTLRKNIKQSLGSGSFVSVLASSHFFFDVIPVVLAQRKVKKTVIVHHIVSLQRKTGLALLYHAVFESMSLFLVKLFDLNIIVVSAYISVKLIDIYGISSDKIYLSSNGIDVANQKENLNKEIDLVYCGRLHKSKGIVDFIEIVKKVKSKKPEIKVTIIGSGPEEQWVTKEIEQSGLSKTVTAVGFVSAAEKNHLMANSHIFVTPTYEEGWGIAIGEALSLGLQVVAYESEELKSVWGDSLYFVNKGEIDEAVECVFNILDSKSDSVHIHAQNKKKEIARSLIETYTRQTVLEKEASSLFEIELNKKPVLLLGSYGRGNIGDDIFLHAASYLFKENRIVINIAHSELLPESVRSRFETVETSFFAGFWSKISLFVKIEAVVYFGGNVWVCMPNNFVKRQHLYKMIFVNVLAKVFRKKVIYIGVGAGHLDPLSVVLARIGAWFSDKIVFRDTDSEYIIDPRKKRSVVLPDLASVVFGGNLKSVQKKKKVVVSFLYHLPEPDKNYIPTRDTIIDSISNLIKKGYQVVFMPMLVSAAEPRDDLWVAQDIKHELKEKLSTTEIKSFSIFDKKGIEDVQAEIQEAEFVIAARLHACIVSVLSGTPVVAISYRDKVSSFMHDNNLGDLVVTLEDINKLNDRVSYILSMYKECESQVSIARTSLIEHAKQYRDICTIKNW